MKRCEAQICSAQVPSEMLMCRRHWGMVPRVIQRAVWRHWKALLASKAGAQQEHQKAKDAAIASVGGR